MADPASPTLSRTHPPGAGIYSLNSFGTRFIPPALIGLGWWLSGLELIEAHNGAKDWKILGIAFPVFWLAAAGARLVSLRPKQAARITAGLALLGVAFGGLASVLGGYPGRVLYSATHASIIASLGLLIFLAMTRSNESRNQAGPPEG
jgi:hypothetical protein